MTNMIWCWCSKTAKRALNVKLPSRNLSLIFSTKMAYFVWICWKNLFWDCTKVCPLWKRTHRNKIDACFEKLNITVCRIHNFFELTIFPSFKNRLYLSIGHLKILSHWVCWVLKLNVMYYSRCTVFINSHTFHEWLLYVMYFMYWLLLCGIKWLNLWSFKARFYLSIGPELSKKWILTILSDLPFTRETKTNVYFSIL